MNKMGKYFSVSNKMWKLELKTISSIYTSKTKRENTTFEFGAWRWRKCEKRNFS
jgi:hypothetical protein